jgi:hypothetical protein
LTYRYYIYFEHQINSKMSEKSVEMTSYPSTSVVPNDSYNVDMDTPTVENTSGGVYAKSFGISAPQTRQQKRYDYHKKHGKPILENIFGGKLLTGQYSRSERGVFISCLTLWMIGTAVFTYLQFINPEEIHESPMDYSDTSEINTRIVKDFTVVGSKATIMHYRNVDSKLTFESPCELGEYYNSAFKAWTFDRPIEEIDGCVVKITLESSITSSNLYRYKELALQNMVITDYYGSRTPINSEHPDLVLTSNVEKGFDDKVRVKKTHKYYDQVETSNSVLVFVSPQTNYYYSISYKTAISTSIAFAIGLLGIIQPVFNLAYDLVMFRCRKGITMFKRLIYIVKKNDNGENEESLVSA